MNSGLRSIVASRPFSLAPTCTLFAFLVLLISPYTASGQGKIAGRVIDKDSGEALIGVNVVIDGTTQGTVTDTNGNYIILNVRPGDYTLAFSYIGFTREVVSGLRVTTGQTTRYDIALSEQVIEGEEIVVRADRPLVRKDLTGIAQNGCGRRDCCVTRGRFFRRTRYPGGRYPGPQWGDTYKRRTK